MHNESIVQFRLLFVVLTQMWPSVPSENVAPMFYPLLNVLCFVIKMDRCKVVVSNG